jgi:hypothetical protein
MKINNPNIPTQELIMDLFKKRYTYPPYNGHVFTHPLWKNKWFLFDGKVWKEREK